MAVECSYKTKLSFNLSFVEVNKFELSLAIYLLALLEGIWKQGKKQLIMHAKFGYLKSLNWFSIASQHTGRGQKTCSRLVGFYLRFIDRGPLYCLDFVPSS